MRKYAERFWPLALTLLFGIAVFLFWNFGYPHALSYQEQFQLFLFDSQYFCERMAEPGGLARYVAEFLVQFYNATAMGALIIALLLVLVQRLVWQLMKPASNARSLYPLSFLPSLMLWLLLGDESVMLTFVVALLLVLTAMWLRPTGKKAQWLYMLIAVPALYWLAGPLVLLFACHVVRLLPFALVYTVALIFASSHVLPYPLQRLVLGIDYYRYPITIPRLMMAVPLVTLLLVWTARRLSSLIGKSARPWVVAIQVAALILVFVGFRPVMYDAKKYLLIQYDYLVRVKKWNAVIALSERQNPDLPMSVSATNLALGMTNQLGDRAFEFYQRGIGGLLPTFERNFTAAQLTGEIYYHLGLVNTAQRFAFETMESLPNYNKSGRVVKRLAETNLINGQYDVARKYLHLLQKTIFYKRWADRTLQLLGNEKAINEHPVYGWLRKARLQNDFLFSEQEVDKMCGQLFMHNPQNAMAMQYLLLCPVLERNVQKAIQYVQVIHGKKNYNPTILQELVAFAYMQARQQPPQGIVSPLVQQNFQDFARSYAQSAKTPESMQRFRNTTWYYLTLGK